MDAAVGVNPRLPHQPHRVSDECCRSGCRFADVGDRPSPVVLRHVENEGLAMKLLGHLERRRNHPQGAFGCVDRNQDSIEHLRFTSTWICDESLAGGPRSIGAKDPKSEGRTYLLVRRSYPDPQIVRTARASSLISETTATAVAANLDGSSPKILASVLAAVVVGGIAWLFGVPWIADLAWAAGVLIALVPLTVTVAIELGRRQTGVDIIALLAMAGALALGQFLAGAVIGLMLSGGEALERYASGRARRELAALLSRAPQVVHVYRDGILVTEDVRAVRAGDL